MASRLPFPHTERLLANLARLRERIGRAEERSGRPAGSVRLVAVAKGAPAAAIPPLIEAGVPDLGENRPEALAGRIRDLGPAAARVRFHMIGRYQRRKVRDTVGYFSCVHSVHSLALIEALNARYPPERAPLSVLLQINPSGEDSKQGMDEAVLREALASAGRWPLLRIDGLMAMAPAEASEAVSRRTFAAVRNTRDRLATAGLPLPELSMGMSGDFEEAILEGATMVRVGSLLFHGMP